MRAVLDRSTRKESRGPRAAVSPVMGRSRRRPWIAAIVLLLMLAAAPAASAHPYLIAATPQSGVVAPSAPSKIQLAFTEALVIKGCSISIKSNNGQTVHVGTITPTLNGYAMSAPVSKLAEGIYTVNWVAYG